MDAYPDNRTPEPSADRAEQRQKLSIEELASLTHEDITRAGVRVLDLLTAPDSVDEVKLKEAWIDYTDLTEEFVNSFEDSKLRSSAQIAAIINKALVFKAAHRTQHYLEELDSAEVYAANEGHEEISATLAAEIRDKVGELDMTPEILVLRLKGVLEDSDREYLRTLIRDGADLEDILGNAYGMILEEGVDPDEIFASIGVTE
jgi:hypothetical protein